ncbi:MAG: hypothetical protein QOG82_532 [Actinomycetota bacterium]|jgi:hypothetical protein|nr:hypothetical protein [Actinomycetota bacterium]
MGIRRTLGVLLVGSLLLVGCGDDGDDTATGGSVTSTSRATTGDTTAAGASIDSAKCIGAATAMASAASAIPQALAGSAASIDASVEQFQAFADAGPSEIKSDLQTVADGYADFVKVLADANYNPASGQAPSPEVQAKIESASQKLEASDFQEAAARVTAWFQAGCKT